MVRLLELLSVAGDTLLVLFGGVLGVILWESTLKPRRERRNIAKALGTEISQNLQHIYSQSHARFQGGGVLPRDFRLIRLAFDAVADRIVELPAEALGRVIRFYALVEYLNNTVLIYSDTLDKIRTTPESAPHYRQLTGEADAAIEAFNVNLDSAFDAANEANRALFKVSKPWWSREKFVLNDGLDLKKKTLERLRQRRKNLGQ